MTVPAQLFVIMVAKGIHCHTATMNWNATDPHQAFHNLCALAEFWLKDQKVP